MKNIFCLLFSLYLSLDFCPSYDDRNELSTFFTIRLSQSKPQSGVSVNSNSEFAYNILSFKF